MQITQPRKKITVVIPAYNEGLRIYQVIRQIRSQTVRAHEAVDILVVDDGSADDTAIQARLAGAQVIRHLVNRGQGAALQTGTVYALAQNCEVVVHFDADGQHEPVAIFDLVEPIMTGQADVTLGSRFAQAMDRSGRAAARLPKIYVFFINWLKILRFKSLSYYRRALLGAALAVNYIITGLPLTDAHNGLRALSRRAAQAMELLHDRMAHASEFVAELQRLDLVYQEILVKINYQLDKKSQGVFDGLKIIKELLFGRSAK